MNFLWGMLMLVVGLYMFISAKGKSEFIIYKLLYARSSKLWGDNTHTFLMVCGLIISLLSFMFFFGIWG